MSALGDRLRQIADDLDANEDATGIALVMVGDVVYEICIEDDASDAQETTFDLSAALHEIVAENPINQFMMH